MTVCKDGHQNEAGGCCCSIHGNTCGFHPEYSQTIPPEGYDTLAEYLNDQPDDKSKLVCTCDPRSGVGASSGICYCGEEDVN